MRGCLFMIDISSTIKFEEFKKVCLIAGFFLCYHVSKSQGFGSNLISYGATPNDTINDTQAFLQALKNADSIFIPEGVFLIDPIINKFRSNQLIEGAGKGRTILRRSDRKGTYLIQQTGKAPINNFTLKNLSIEGLPNYRHSLVQFKDSKNLNIINVSFKYAGSTEEENGRSTLLRIDWTTPDVRNGVTKVIDCDFEAFFYGIHYRPYAESAGGNILIESCVFRDSDVGHASSAILLGAHGQGEIKNVTIVNNRFFDLDDTAIMLVGRSINYENISIIGNWMETYQVGIWLDANATTPARDVSIKNNIITSEIDKGIHIEHAIEVELISNYVYDCGFSGITLFDVTGGIITGNKIEKNGQRNVDRYTEGLLLSSLVSKGSSKLIVSGNHFDSNKGHQLAITAYSDSIEVSDNYFTSNSSSSSIFVPLAFERHQAVEVYNNYPLETIISYTDDEEVKLDFISFQYIRLETSSDTINLSKVETLPTKSEEHGLSIVNKSASDQIVINYFGKPEKQIVLQIPSGETKAYNMTLAKGLQFVPE